MKLINPIDLVRKRRCIVPFIKMNVVIWANKLARRGIPITKNQRKLAQLKGIHKGKTAFLIGNGPSVRIADLETMQSSITFCCNKFYKAYGMVKFRPIYTIACDRQMIEDFGDEIVQKSEGKKFIVLEHCPGIVGEFIWIRLKHLKPEHLFKNSIYDYVTTGGGTLIVAMQIGYFMGITKYYLYGVDHSFSYTIDRNEKDNFKIAMGDSNHFIPNYREGKKWCPPNTPQIEKAFKICDSFMRSRGGFVKNATRGGKLEILERVDFDMVKRMITVD